MADESVIGPGTIIRGHVRGEGSLVVAGRVEGDIEMTGDVTLTSGSAVKGNVTGAAVRAGGDVAGDISGSASIIIEGEARVVGDVRSPSIGILEGARIRGNVQSNGASGMGADEVRAAVAAPRVTARAPTPPRAATAAATPAPTKAAEPARRPPPTAKVQAAPAAATRTKATIKKTAAKTAAKTAGKKRPPAPVVPAMRKGRKASKKTRR